MPGYVHVVNADIRRLACDAWLLPTDAEGRVEAIWLDGMPEDFRAEVERAATGPWRTRGDAATLAVARRRRAPWLTDVARGAAEDPEAVMQAVEAFLARAAASPWVREAERERPLLALPLVGTGAGGWSLPEILQLLLERLHAFAASAEVDVALVARNPVTYSGLQWVRRAWHRRQGVPEPGLADPYLRAEARRLAEKASRGELVLFVGAGASRGAGLPDWKGLLEALAVRAGLSEDERASLRALGSLDRARLLERRLSSSGGELRQALTGILASPCHGLVHGYLTGLPVREVVTTNFDTLLEQAACGIGRPLQVLPADDAESGRWLLKLHGSIEAGQDLVFSREQYLRFSDRYSALSGVVQSLLMTRHMLFVGFSLDDDNFHRVVDAVRKVLGPGSPAAGRRFGTQLDLVRKPFAEELWAGEIQLVPMRDADEASSEVLAQAARELEIFLDQLAYEAVGGAAHFLDPRFDGLLSDAQRGLKTAVLQLAERLGETPEDALGPERGVLRRCLEALGWSAD